MCETEKSHLCIIIIQEVVCSSRQAISSKGCLSPVWIWHLQRDAGAGTSWRLTSLRFLAVGDINNGTHSRLRQGGLSLFLVNSCRFHPSSMMPTSGHQDAGVTGLFFRLWPLPVVDIDVAAYFQLVFAMIHYPRKKKREKTSTTNETNYQFMIEIRVMNT